MTPRQIAVGVALVLILVQSSRAQSELQPAAYLPLVVQHSLMMTTRTPTATATATNTPTQDRDASANKYG